MKIALGSDHAGFRCKEIIMEHLKSLGFAARDLGTCSEEAVDRPVFIRPMAQAVARDAFDCAIALGGLGNGEAMTANRIGGSTCACKVMIGNCFGGGG